MEGPIPSGMYCTVRTPANPTSDDKEALGTRSEPGIRAAGGSEGKVSAADQMPQRQNPKSVK
jgi:hypothetical protein